MDPQLKEIQGQQNVLSNLEKDQNNMQQQQMLIRSDKTQEEQRQELFQQNEGDSSLDDINQIEDERFSEENYDVDRLYLQQLVMNEERCFQKIVEMNNEASSKLGKGKQKEALDILLKAEKILEFAAQCGKSIDRNLIIVVLYNRACAYQSLWILDKCSKYVDGVIYNLEISIEEEQQKEINKNNTDIEHQKFYISHKAKKLTFLAKSYLQYCAILSQLGMHQQSLDTAKQAIIVLQKIFKDCYQFCVFNKINKDNPQQFQTNEQSGIESSGPNQMAKEQIKFQSQVIEYAFKLLSELIQVLDQEDRICSQQLNDQFEQARKSLYYWKNNPENNERHIRQELNVPLKLSPQDNRSLLGVANGNYTILRQFVRLKLLNLQRE